MVLICPDTSAVLAGVFSRWLEEESTKSDEVIKVLLPRIVLAEIENLANRKREVGLTGIRELKKITEANKLGKCEIEVIGERPPLGTLEKGAGGELDALIREQARINNAKLITCDRVQADIARVENMDVLFFKREEEAETRSHKRIEDFFIAEDVMSVHLKENCLPFLKRGQPGRWELESISELEPLSKQRLNRIAEDVIEKARILDGSFIEIDRVGCTVVQLQAMRIVIARPPFSEGVEITAVRPIVRLSLDDYDLSENLQNRFEKAEGILVAGPPGAGKSTFAQAIADYYASKDKIVKTLEKPRDLQVGDAITQYSALDGDMAKTADVLLLMRPDYVIYDELRETDDFKVFSDLRLSGVGMLGIIHSSKAIDAIQRFLGRIDLGVIPQVIDTVVFIEDGGIRKVLSLRSTVKVPTGMIEADLARPVVVISDFETGISEFEIYEFGSQTVVMPVSGDDTRSSGDLSQAVQDSISNYTSGPFEVVPGGRNRFQVNVSSRDYPRVLGKGGKTVHMLEKRLGVRLDIKKNFPGKNYSESANMHPTGGEKGHHLKKSQIQMTKKQIILDIGKNFSKRQVAILGDGDEILLTATVGRGGSVKISRKTDVGASLLRSIRAGEVLTCMEL